MARLEMYFLGQFHVTMDGEPVSEFRSQKERALLAYLAVEAGRIHQREMLAGLLWPEVPDRKARSNLRLTLHRLRKTLNDLSQSPCILEVDPDTLQFHLDVCWLDFSAFTQLLDDVENHPHSSLEECFDCHLKLEQAAALYRGEFLQDFFVDDSQAFTEWTLLKREWLHRRFLPVLYKLADYHLQKGDFEQARSFAYRQLELEPWREEAHRQMMAILVLCNEKSAALRQYDICRQVLADELGAEPDEKSKRLYEDIVQGRFSLESLRSPSPDRDKARTPGNLPASLTSFIGRESEIAELVALLHPTASETLPVRLLTVTGPPGSGKTRLALETASRLSPHYKDGVYFVDLASVEQVEFIPAAMVRALGLVESPLVPQLDLLRAHLSKRHTLLVLDNFEHLLEGGPMVSELLKSAPELQVMVTSREDLRLYGEHTYSLLPLELPPAGAIASLGKFGQVEAVRLFSERAKAVREDFEISAENAPLVAEICSHLDGLPLALELAAARLKYIRLEGLSEELANRFATLSQGPRDVHTRHKTLRAAIDWSYQLLDENEKKLFSRLSVFQGGRSLEAVEKVCSPGLQLDIRMGMESLFAKSLVQKGRDSLGETRFTLLETIHEYAREALESYGDREQFQRCHAEYFLDIAEADAVSWKASKFQNQFLRRLSIELTNYRKALDWALGGGDIELGLRLVGALGWFWDRRFHMGEGRRWVSLAFEKSGGAEPVVLAKLHRTAALILFSSSDLQDCAAHYFEAARIFQELGKQNELARAYSRLALVMSALNPDSPESVLSLNMQAITTLRELDDCPALCLSMNDLGEVHRFYGNYRDAKNAYEESLRLANEIGDEEREIYEYINLGYVAQHQGDYKLAEILAFKALENSQALDIRHMDAYALYSYTSALGMQGRYMRAALLMGAVEAYMESYGIIPDPVDLMEFERSKANACGKLGTSKFEAVWADGRKMSLEQAIDYARG